MDEDGVFSVDFLLSVMIIMFIFTGLINIISERAILAEETQKLSQSRIQIEKISNALNKVYCGGYGQKINIKLPEKIGNSTYLVKIKYSAVYVEIEGKKGKTPHYPMTIVDSNLKNVNELVIIPGKSYYVENIPLNHSFALKISEIK
ncbi:hypothetical protein [Methanobacterium alcaliphilum]|uniref:hypothetical protein n=1 Tax=Methanobacterium alcaliphilum TaxID=392018 RepID=UPI00200B0D38|nr:hypothetical protein [Methanobacterium alcaliphilum]MCK9152477.1 hypothetical protein [Methanobacterium alcaliphilum]